MSNGYAMTLKEAPFHDGTNEYMWPENPKPGDLVTFRLRLPVTINGKVKMTAVEGMPAPWGRYETQDVPSWEIALQKEEASEVFAYYTASVRLGTKPFHYYFVFEQDGLAHTFCRSGLDREEPQKEAFSVVPGSCLPEWMKGAVIYQIFVDRFRNGNPENDVKEDAYVYLGKKVRNAATWEELPETLDVGIFHGGDLDGVREKFRYLIDLGIEVLYLNPIFLSPSNHKYDTQDYDVVDPHYTIGEGEKGLLSKETAEKSNAFFAEFMTKAHAAGLRVILDGVFNHCGSFHRWMDREKYYGGEGAYRSDRSPYRSFFRFEDPDGWPDNDSYEKWWGVETLPKLNYDASEKLCEEVLKIAEKWVSPPYCADGWRLDVAADLGHSEAFNHAFWSRFRRAVQKANPQAVVLAEHYEAPGAWLKSSEWDTVMNYPGFMDPVSHFFTGMEKHSDAFCVELFGNTDAFRESMLAARADFPENSYYAAMNELSNHDHSRFLTRTNGHCGRLAECGAAAASEGIDRSVFAEAVFFQMTWPGAPTVYYGDEAGVCGFTDPDNRRVYPWEHEDTELIKLHRGLIALHKEHPALKRGSCVFLDAADESGEGNGILAYARFMSDERCVMVINHRTEAVKINVPVLAAEILEGTMLKEIIRVGGDTLFSAAHDGGRGFLVKDGLVKIEVAGRSAVMLQAAAAVGCF